MGFLGFGSKDSPDTKPTPPKLTQPGGKPSTVPPVPLGQLAKAPDAPPPPVEPSIAFDATSIESIRSSFNLMVKAFDELKKLNEEHRNIQKSNLEMFMGVKDREIADLRKDLEATRKQLGEKQKQAEDKSKNLEDAILKIEKLNADVVGKDAEIKCRVDEIVGIRKDLEESADAMRKESSAHEQTRKNLEERERQFVDLQAAKDLLAKELEVEKKKLEDTSGDLAEVSGQLESMHVSSAQRLANYLPQGVLKSRIASQVVEFDSAASAGDTASLRVIAGLSQLRAAFIPGAGPDDKLIAVKSIGMALYAAWSSQSKDAKEIHALFAEWQNFLNDLPGAGYQLVVPDLGQNVPQNVTAPAGVTKVAEVQLWIVKGEAGSIYSRGIVR